MSTKRDKIEIQFIGNNSQEVTGSCIWIKTPDRQILLELGLYQTCGNNATLKQYKINSAHFKFKPKEIDYIFVCHTHQDHLGLTPRAYYKGATCPLIMPEGSKKLAEILLLDSAKIMQSDCIELKKQYHHDYYPIYTEDDVDNALEHLQEYPMNELIELDEFIKFRFIPSGHILNSAQLELYITCGNLVKKILYTSDLGNIHIEKHFINKFQPSTMKPNMIIGESTYGREERVATQKTREKDLEKLKTVVEQTCIEDRARLLIPVFANARCQELIISLYELFKDDQSFKIPVLIDSPMAIKICKLYSELLSGEELDKWKEAIQWKNLVFLSDSLESKAWRDDNTPAIILSSSGMLTKGRSIYWAQKLVPYEKNRIVFCGYSAEGSVGAALKECKQKTVTIGGVRFRNKCQITNLTSFSSHMQFDSLIDYYASIDCEKVVLVHGEENSKLNLAPKIEEKISENNKTSKVVIATKDYIIKI